MEEGILDIYNESHLFALHYVYIPQISKALNAFISGLNHNSLSSCHQKTPMQLYTEGMVLLNHSGIPALDYTTPVDTEEYGIEDDLDDMQSDNDALQSLVNPLQESANYGVELYISTDSGILKYCLDLLSAFYAICYSLSHSLLFH